MNKYNFNYITTNKTNGKQYIGSHTTNRLDDGYLGSGTEFKKDLFQYGKNNFQREIITFTFSFIEAKENEVMFIGKYDTLYPKGYNKHCKGGNYSIKEINNNILQIDLNDIIDKCYELYSDYNVFSYDIYLKLKEKILRKDIQTIKKLKNIYVKTLNRIYQTSMYKNY